MTNSQLFSDDKFSKTLFKALDRGGLTQTELAIWLDSNRNSVRNWLAGMVPKRYRQVPIENRINLLLKAIKKGDLPLKTAVREDVRRDEIKRVLDVYLNHTGIS